MNPTTDYVYIIGETGTANVKIGTSSTPTRRLAQLQTGNPRKLFFIDSWAVIVPPCY